MIKKNKDIGVIKRVFVTPDKHFPLADKKAINVVKKAIEIVKPDVYIDLGDVDTRYRSLTMMLKMLIKD